MKKITSENFRAAFSKVWTRSYTIRADFQDQYRHAESWTSFMLHEGFLHKVMLDLRQIVPGLEYKTEWHKIDAVYVAGEDLFRDGLAYPSELHVLIEHERGEHIEEEICKLVHWRAPLKVLITYDWSDGEKTNSRRREWISKKINKINEMLAKVWEFNPENDTTEYLVLVGNPCNSSGQFEWCWTSTTSTGKLQHPKPLTPI